MTINPYNPLDKLNLGNSVAEALLQQPVMPLDNLQGLTGAGVYAIYYTGNFRLYTRIAERNRNDQFNQPIYVGKAVPKGSRKGGISYDASTGTAMRDRLNIHAASINEAENLEIKDFQCRALMVDDVWIPLGENMMIELFKPIWNLVIDGFGNKVPGKRRPQNRSRWDILHPGRKRNLADGSQTVEMVEERLNLFFRGQFQPVVILDDGSEMDDETEGD